MPHINVMQLAVNQQCHTSMHAASGESAMPHINVMQLAVNSRFSKKEKQRSPGLNPKIY